MSYWWELLCAQLYATGGPMQGPLFWNSSARRWERLRLVTESGEEVPFPDPGVVRQPIQPETIIKVVSPPPGVAEVERLAQQVRGMQVQPDPEIPAAMDGAKSAVVVTAPPEVNHLQQTPLWSLGKQALYKWTDTDPQEGELWKHTKSGAMYRVHCCAHDEETLAPVIVYAKVDSDLEAVPFFVRTLKVFLERFIPMRGRGKRT